MALGTRQLLRGLRVAAVFVVVWLVLRATTTTDGLSSATSIPLWPARGGGNGDDTDADLCRPHGWAPFRPASPDHPRKVYDLLMFNTELDHLEIRLNTTYAEVDYFVLVESSKTFTGLDKPLTLHANLASRFRRYLPKIIYHEISYPPGFAPRTPWDMEDHQRNAMLTQVFPRLRGAQAPRAGDVLVVSDLDEMPRPSTLRLLRACRFPRRLTLASRFYYYSFQWLHRGPEWPHPQATYYQGLADSPSSNPSSGGLLATLLARLPFLRGRPGTTLLPNDLRIADGGVWPFREWEKGVLANASWHCSSCFARVGELLDKMAAFSHTSMNAAPFRDRARIVDRVRQGKDLWDRPGQEYERVEGNGDVPRFVLENKGRFGYMLDRDGRDAGFVDYEEE
ncbi:glycosyltransferase [Staphylotrichum tortipilum]|uniref:Glycosyltransferase n=1 Tax=Staphylotrichum tortipilum TaxID=2831512 RepID=A0AAN6RS33_9PEZI|nr:glycosyltransferase [Staphylotrichum longicolle]